MAITRIVATDAERAALVQYIETRPLPITVTVASGKRRSLQQNNLQAHILAEVARQLGDRTADDVRAYCKLHFGIPILRRDDEFRAAYDKHVRPLPYETKLAYMAEPISWPVTRLMTVEQKTEYLDTVMRHFAEQGVIFQMEAA